MKKAEMADRNSDRVPLVAPTTVTLPLGLLPEPKCLGLSLRTVNVIALGLSFCFLFTAFNPTQNYQSTTNPDYGETTLAVLYLVFSISGFTAATTVSFLTEKWAMTIGASTYVIYMGTNIIYSFDDLKGKFLWSLFVGAGMCGWGASMLWTAQGAFLSKNSTKETMGRNTGIFFGLFQVNQIIGNLLAGFLLSIHQPYWVLFTIITSLGAAAVLTFLFLRHPPAKQEVDEEDDAPKRPKTILQKFAGTFRTLFSARFALFACLIIYSGLSQSFFFGKFTKFISGYSQDYVGYVMAVFGGCDVIGSFAFGKITDIVGRKPIILLGTICTLAGTSIILIFPEYSGFHQKLYLYFFCAVLFGFADAAFFTSIYATISVLFNEDIENGFGAFRLLQSTTTAANFFFQKYLSIYYAVLLLDSFLLVGVLCYFIIDFCVTPVDGDKTKEKNVQHM